MDWRGLRHRLEYFAFQLFVCVLQAFSPRRCAALAGGLAWIVHHCLPRKLTRYHVARDNLRAALGDGYSDADLDEIIYGMWKHLFRMVAEIVHLPRKLHRNNVTGAVQFRNRPLVLRALCSGRPVVLLSGHFGNWEMAVALFGLFGFRMAVVARELDNPHLNAWFRRFRQCTGHRMLAKKGGYSEMLDLLERRGHLAMLGDQDAGPRGLFVNFFGRPASTFRSIALLAVEYRALICVGYARRLNDDASCADLPRYEVGCEAIIDPLEIEADDEIAEITQQYTAALERVIRMAPEQYFWVHRRWKSRPHRRSRPAARKRAG